MSIFSISECYKACNDNYSATNPGRIFCKKGCDSDDDITACKNTFCSNLCIKQELGDDEKKPGWSKFFARAPGTDTSDDCLSACILGCRSKEADDDD